MGAAIMDMRRFDGGAASDSPLSEYKKMGIYMVLWVELLGNKVGIWCIGGTEFALRSWLVGARSPVEAATEPSADRDSKDISVADPVALSTNTHCPEAMVHWSIDGWLTSPQMHSDVQ
jgi:hypothetical protein